MPREVVDGHEGEAAGPGQRLRGREADEQRPHQARPAGHGDALHTIERRVRGGERLADDRGHELQMATGGDLQDDAP